MQVAVNFQNETIAQKVLWMLEHFKNDGVEVVKLDNTDDEVINNFKEGIEELKKIKSGELKAIPIEKLLDEL
jgi:redox-regulated HSP33 family molecular chaperone